MTIRRAGALLALCLGLIGCAETQLAAHVASVARPDASRGHYKVGVPYTIKGVRYVPQEDMAYDRKGIASWYGPGFHGKQTANGEIFDANDLTAAHPTLQLPSIVRVTNLENGRSVVLRVNDRGPFADNRLIDISKRGAELLGFRRKGTAMVRVQLLAEETLAAIPPEEAARIRTVAVMKRQAPPPVDTTPEPIQVAGHAPPLPAVIPGSSGAGDARLQQASLVSPAVARATAPPPGPAPVPAAPQAFRGNPIFPAMPYPVHRPGPGPAQAAPATAPTQVAAAPAADQPAAARWYVQTGAFSVYENAKRIGTRLTSMGRVEIQALDHADGPIYSVRMGPLQTREQADRLALAVGNAGINHTRVMVD